MYGLDEGWAELTQHFLGTTQDQQLCTLHVYFHEIGSHTHLPTKCVKGDGLDKSSPNVPPFHLRRSGNSRSKRIHRAVTGVDQKELPLHGIYLRDRFGNNCPL